jgi:UDP-N-acetylglucosamine transferase subunit ALG13
MNMGYETFVVLGNMDVPFQRLVDIVLESAEFLPKPILIQGKNIRLKSISNVVIIVESLPFTEFNDILANSKVIISHAGVGSIVQSLKSGKRPILIPRRSKFNEHINDHQLILLEYLLSFDDLVFSFESSDDLQLIINNESLILNSDVNIPLFSNDKIVNDIKIFLSNLK